MAWRISAFGKRAPMKKQDGGHRAPRPSAMATSKERRKLGSLSSLHSPIRSDVETVIESRAAADWIRGAEGLHQYDYLAEPSIRRIWVENQQNSAADEVLGRRSLPVRLSATQQTFRRGLGPGCRDSWQAKSR